jgi:outer membrane receptor for ferrienterochelin and colicins
MRFRGVLVLVIILFVALPLSAQATGVISGRVTRPNGTGIPGVVVVVDGLSKATTTDANGAFSMDGIPAGSHTLSFTAGEHVETAPVEVSARATTILNKQVDWQMSFADQITVYSASRQVERIVEAPAAVSVVAEEELQMAAPTGQLPKVLESAPGVDFTQSGTYDFNFNTRGFNSSLNRRILTLIDGRDPSVPFLGAQEWGAVSYPLDEMASVELVRGPGSALYGANAFNGVLNMTTREPRYSEGGRVQVTVGDLDTRRIDLRYADELGGGWFWRLVGGYQESKDFAESRNASVEYSHICGQLETSNCLRREARPLALFSNEIAFAGLRLDKYFDNGHTLTTEVGSATLEGPIFQTGIGRVQVTDVERPWARLNYNTHNFNFLAYYDSRNADNQVALASGAPLFEDSHNLHGELQGHVSFLNARGRLVGGVAWHEQDIDTANPAGVQTLMLAAHKEDQQAVFGQFEYDITDSLKTVVAARWDDSSLHDAQVSPKASLVYSPTRDHSIRLNYNEAFQVPNYSEFFLAAPAAAPINLAALETALRPLLGGVALGFTSVPVLARGNDDLDVEEITSYEIGYSGIFGGKLYVTADYYQNNIQNFVTDLLPGVNRADFPVYAPPSQLPAQVQAVILAQLRANLPPSIFAGFTNLANGNPAVVFSYTNAGEVDTQGVEVSMNYYLTNNWLIDANYSWFDFDVKEQQLGDVLLPNAPENKYNLGIGYRGTSFDASLKYRWVDDFFWAAGVFQGPVDSYDVVNLSGAYHFLDHYTVGVNVSNALDDEHYETFGGDILERRALFYLGVNW